MSKQIRLSKNPITEALLGIRLDQDPSFTVRSLEEMHREIEKDFPIKQVNTLWETSFQLKVGKEPKLSSKDSFNGFFFKDAKGERIIQARKDGFTFNNIRRYQDWDQFSSEAKKYWNIYLKFSKPIFAKRLALRYINLLDLPQPINSLKVYLVTVPDIAKGIPQQLSEYYMKLDKGQVRDINSLILSNSTQCAVAKDKIHLENLTKNFDYKNHRKSRVISISESGPYTMFTAE